MLLNWFKNHIKNCLHSSTNTKTDTRSFYYYYFVTLSMLWRTKLLLQTNNKHIFTLDMFKLYIKVQNC